MISSSRGHVIAIAAALSVFAAGCTEPAGQGAKNLLVDAAAAYDRDRSARVIELTDRYLLEYPGAPNRDEALYLRGMSHYRLGQFIHAEADLKRVLKETQKTSLRAFALTQMGEIAFQKGQLEQAEDFCRQAIAIAARGVAPSDKAHYRLGCALQRLGRWGQADVAFGHVMYLFGGSELARLASDRHGGRAWTVRAGTYERKEFAKAEASRLRQRGVPAQIDTAVRGDRLYYRIQVGRYESFDQALRSLPAVARHQPDAYVTVTP
jgi:tetratricopeptide (TPR) repeat protein